MNVEKNFAFFLNMVSIILFTVAPAFAQNEVGSEPKHPVILDSDTLFFIHASLGTFNAERRTSEINSKLKILAKNDTLIYDSIKTIEQLDYFLLQIFNEPIMAITKTDALYADTSQSALADCYKELLIKKLKERRETYSQKSLIRNGLFSLLYIVLLMLFIWLTTKTFPWLYKKIERLDKSKIRNLKFKDQDVIQSSTIVKLLIITAKGIRFVLAVIAIYFFITQVLHVWPYTRKLDFQPIIKSIALLVFYTALFVALFKSINSAIDVLNQKYVNWKGEKIKPVKIKTVEILSADRSVEFLTLVNKVLRFAIQATLIYTYITVVFNLFTFSETWAEKLLGYVLNPLNSVGMAFINFLPDLFFIIVLLFVFNYIIRAVKFFFMEIDNGNIEFPGFHKEWAVPTFKIVRFLILVLAAIVIFPYLPGSSSPFFQGISVFLGILFSLGSSSAISNMVAGIVLTYMRPFKIGDRVKIAETMGDVVEKTLLVTRIRTNKNVDITVPNAMVLGSHIINYSSSAADKGLILNTTVTIGYDVPWKQVHELLISAANETEYLLAEPKPFVLQTSLDDFYVSYELNVFTNNPQQMAGIYSQLHSKIQDKFNEASVEIMSPHYGAMRDGNQTTIPPEHLPKEYKAPSFRLFGVNLFGDKKD